MLLSFSKTLFLLIIVTGVAMAAVNEEIVWNMNSLTTIGGNSISVAGSPKLIETVIGQAVEFIKSPDQILVKNNPLGDATQWTIQTIIKPYEVNSFAEPRYFHFQNPDNADKRIMMELRVNTNKTWYFDAFVKSTKNSRVLIDSKLTHPTDKWYNATITYANGVLTSYINGVKELSGTVDYEPIDDKGIISLGSRMNNIGYLKGAIHKVVFTKTALSPDQFDKSYLGTSTITPRINQMKKPSYVNSIAVMINRTPELYRSFTLTGKVFQKVKDTHPVYSGVIITKKALLPE